MKIAEISEPILEVLRKKEFVGDFKVTIYHAGIDDVEITGYKPNKAAYPYDFSRELQSKVNEICFKIVSGVLADGDFTFDISGQIAYLYKHAEDLDV